MRAIFIIMMLICIFFTQALYADSCNVITMLPDACPMIDNSNDINSSPYFYKNPNVLCGITLSLPGLPSLNFPKGRENLSDLNFCGFLSGVDNDLKTKIEDKVNQLLPNFMTH